MFFWRPPGCIIVWSLAVRPKRQRQRQRGGGAHLLLGGAEQLLWGCGQGSLRETHMKVRRAEKPPAGKAAGLPLGPRGPVGRGRDRVGPGLGRVGPSGLYLLVRTDWWLWDMGRRLK